MLCPRLGSSVIKGWKTGMHTQFGQEKEQHIQQSEIIYGKMFELMSMSGKVGTTIL